MWIKSRSPHLVLDVDAGSYIALEEGQEDRQGVHLAHGCQHQGGEEGEVGKSSCRQEESLGALGGPAEVGEGGHQVEGVLGDAQDVVVLLYPWACNLERPEIKHQIEETWLSPVQAPQPLQLSQTP